MSELHVKTVLQKGKTLVSDCFFTSPLKIAKPFYRNNGNTELMVMCAGPGMLEGDCYSISFELGEGTQTVVSGQSYQKLFQMGQGKAGQSLNIQVGENAAFAYLPHPVIPFAGSRFLGRTEISLKASSKLFFWEAVTCGRAGMGERFAFSEFSSRTCVTLDGQPVFLDNTRLLPEEASLRGIGFFEGRAAQGFLYLYGYDSEFDSLSEFLSEFLSEGPPDNMENFTKIEAAVSKAEKGLVLRVLGQSGADVFEFSKRIWAKVEKKERTAVT